MGGKTVTQSQRDVNLRDRRPREGQSVYCREKQREARIQGQDTSSATDRAWRLQGSLGADAGDACFAESGHVRAVHGGCLRQSRLSGQEGGGGTHATSRTLSHFFQSVMVVTVVLVAQHPAAADDDVRCSKQRG
jgi:hypothetical protein